MDSKHTRTSKSSTSLFLIALLIWPVVVIVVSFVASSIIYNTFHPPAIFDELTPDATSSERIAYTVNSTLFNIIVFTLLAGYPLSAIAGIAFFIKHVITERIYAKD